jgi:ABC-type nitrate/sulfonate/bicarbonate transport system substrate-binding protein
VFGTSAHYPAVKWMLDAGLTPGKDVQVLNMAAAEGRVALAKGDIDALTIWDPYVADMIDKKSARVLVQKPSFLTTVIASDAFLRRDPEGATRFLKALYEAVLFMHYHKDLANGWLSRTNGTTPAIIDKGSRFNANYSGAKKMKDVELVPGENLLSLLESISAFNVENRLQSGPTPIREKTDLSFVKAARARALAEKFDPEKVRIKAE